MIDLQISNHLASLTFNRTKKKNALTQLAWVELAGHVSSLSRDDNIRLLMLRGAGGDFCAGADITEFDEVRRNRETALAYEAANSAAFAAIRDCPFPTLAVIQGCCFGGGFGIAAGCDLRVGDHSAKFCLPPARLGLAYPVEAMADIVHALGPQRAKLMAYSAQVMDAVEAQRTGFLAQLYAPENLDREIEALCATICANAPLSNRASKASIRAVLSGKPDDIDAAIDCGNRTFSSEDYGEGRAAFAARRKPVFRGK